MTVSLEILSPKTVNRLYMVKQHLFRRTDTSQLERVVEDICGLQAQVPATPYFSLWNRIENFQNTLLDKALYKDKTLVKEWCMRGTLHIIPSKDLPIYNKALKKMWFEHHGRFMRAPEWPPAEERRKVVYPKIFEALAQRTLTRKELNDKVRSSLKDGSLPYDRLFSGWGGVLKETGYEGMTVHAQPRGRESHFARLDKWLPNVNLDSVDEEEAQEKLLLKYLRGYGPASQQDFALWSGLVADDAKRAIENASSQLSHVGIEGVKGEFLLLEENRKTLESMDLDEKAPPRLLPKYDSVLLGHRDRTRIIQEEHRKTVFKPKVGDIAATLLLDGRIAGTWRHKRTKKTLSITVESFEKMSREDIEQAESEAKELSQFMGLTELKFQVTPLLSTLRYVSSFVVSDP
jgi:uncharacterized protein YcaQ